MNPPRRRCDKGQALAEFALVAPILFLLLFGVLQLGLLFGGQNALVDGTRNAARRAATYRVNDASLADGSILAAVCTSIRTEENAQLARMLPAFSATRLQPPSGHLLISYVWESNPGPAPSGANPANYFLYVRIQVAYAHPLYVPLVGIFFDALDGHSDNSFTLTASEEMRVENPSLPIGTDASCP